MDGASEYMRSKGSIGKNQHPEGDLADRKAAEAKQLYNAALGWKGEGESKRDEKERRVELGRLTAVKGEGGGEEKDRDEQIRHKAKQRTTQHLHTQP
ncbi:hypothetical protein PZA11_004745 [Diplocarpon coronariae]|nr:hypothetical protein JHW43_003465 [Diplocarpon mali]